MPQYPEIYVLWIMKLWLIIWTKQNKALQNRKRIFRGLLQLMLAGHLKPTPMADVFATTPTWKHSIWPWPAMTSILSANYVSETLVMPTNIFATDWNRCHANQVRSLYYASISNLHGDVITWKHIPNYRPFVKGIHTHRFPHKGSLI